VDEADNGSIEIFFKEFGIGEVLRCFVVCLIEVEGNFLCVVDCVLVRVWARRHFRVDRERVSASTPDFALEGSRLVSFKPRRISGTCCGGGCLGLSVGWSLSHGKCLLNQMLCRGSILGL
jgi:hypothetical protein